MLSRVIIYENNFGRFLRNLRLRASAEKISGGVDVDAIKYILFEQNKFEKLRYLVIYPYCPKPVLYLLKPQTKCFF